MHEGKAETHLHQTEEIMLLAAGIPTSRRTERQLLKMKLQGVPSERARVDMQTFHLGGESIASKSRH